jgi:hypothetical protein
MGTLAMRNPVAGDDAPVDTRAAQCAEIAPWPWLHRSVVRTDPIAPVGYRNRLTQIQLGEGVTKSMARKSKSMAAGIVDEVSEVLGNVVEAGRAMLPSRKSVAKRVTRARRTVTSKARSAAATVKSRVASATRKTRKAGSTAARKTRTATAKARTAASKAKSRVAAATKKARKGSASARKKAAPAKRKSSATKRR